MGQNRTQLNMQNLTALSLRDKIRIVWELSVPGILAQISEIAMQYIDSAMVGSLGADASASIGLVSSSTWLIGGLISAAAGGFNVQIAHASGAGDHLRARRVMKCALISTLVFSLILCAAAVFLSPFLPRFLGGSEEIIPMAAAYFGIFALFIPVREMFYLHVGALQCTGNMKTPGILSAAMCGFDVVFNYFLIFPTHRTAVGVTMPGAGLGVAGAALGTAFSYVVMMIAAIICVWKSSPVLSLKYGVRRGEESKSHSSREQFRGILGSAVRIGLPIALEQTAMCSAQVYTTRIVSPLGTNALAANSFAVTAEALCYMPGYGIQGAATTLVGQAYGARRKDLVRSFGWLTTLMGMAIMSLCGMAMYFLCPYVFAFLTPVKEVRELGVKVLRIELFAEPMFGASIVSAGALRGVGDTLIPAAMSLVSIWGVRVTLASFLAPRIGLEGAWIAMCIELTFRGIIFLIRLARQKDFRKNSSL